MPKTLKSVGLVLNQQMPKSAFQNKQLPTTEMWVRLFFGKTSLNSEDTKLTRILPKNEFIQKQNLKKEYNSQKIGYWVSKCR